MKNLGEIMFDFDGTHVYLCDDEDENSPRSRLSFVDGNLVCSFDMDADQLQRLADAICEHRIAMFDEQKIQCPSCGYTWDDANLHGDHRNCRRYPFFPDEKGNTHAAAE